MLNFSGFVTFRIDSSLSHDLRKSLDVILSNFKDATIEDLSNSFTLPPGRLAVDFISENSLHLIKPAPSLKICLLDKNQGLFSFGQSIESSEIDAVLDDSLDALQLQKLIEPMVQNLMRKQEDSLQVIGAKNIKKFETKARQETAKSLEAGGLTSESLLSYAQALVDLEKELIHTVELSRIEKVIKQFVKTHVEKAKFQFFTSKDISHIEPSANFLTLPRYKGEFLALEMSWDDAEYSRLSKKLFFFYTLVNFFAFKQDIQDPFFDDSLWDSVLDSIPFPVALLSETAEVYQHNTLFSKLNVAPSDCLKYKLREKILINDIPYNVFRKEVHHLDEKKILFVFFTESFFLKGDNGNLTPSGQELGIISSSIAHELNNPIAGIQAALSLLMLGEMNDEAKQTLFEMKNGATRCKQLIETFLGFSRANPKSLTTLELQLSPIEVCYQQAQNLLRFRTVESGIRFNFTFSRHSEFRATVNLSLMTMTYYLILGELMTLYSHQLLVADKNQIEKVIKGEIIESSQEIQIQLHELNISNLNLSKLIQNLLTIENFVLQVSDYSLRFIYNPPNLKDG
jgi:hypothetical protein